jgi:hypothetical protein
MWVSAVVNRKLTEQRQNAVRNVSYLCILGKERWRHLDKYGQSRRRNLLHGSFYSQT